MKTGGPFPYKFKEYINIDKQSISNGLIGVGVYLTITTLHDSPSSEYCVNIFISNGAGEYSPASTILLNKGFKIGLGWYNSLEFTEGEPSGKIDFVSYKFL